MHLVGGVSIRNLDGYLSIVDSLIRSLLIIHTTSHGTTVDGIYDTIHGEEPYDCQTLRLR